MMTEIYRVSEKHADDFSTIEDSPHVSGADGDTAPVPQGRAERKFNLRMVLLIFSLLLVAAPIFFSIYYFIKLNRKEQELEELRIANYNLTSNNSALLAAHAILQSEYERNNSYLQESRDTLQSQYAALNKKHEELANKFSKLQEYYCDVTNTSHDFIKLNRKEQELEELRIANYNLTSNNSALQSQYTTLNKKHEELANKFSKLQEYYCDVTNTSHGNTCPLCKVGWIPFVSKCYFISTKTLTWNESHDWCLTKGGQLVNIEDSKKWDFLSTQSKIIGGDPNFFWFGQYDIIEVEKSTKIDDEPVKSNRASDDNKRNCLVLQLESNLMFRTRCEVHFRWICEFAAFPLRI